MATGWSDSTDGPHVSVDLPGQGAERRVAATVLAALLVVGALMGAVNLFLDGPLHDGGPRLAYTAALVLCVLVAVPLAVRRRIGPWALAGLVLLGDLIYVVIALSVADPLRFATPLMLLFSCFVAAWYLEGGPLAVHMVAVVGACWVALADGYDSTAAVAVQVGVNAGVLDVATLGVFLLRRRVQRLLDATRQLSSTDPLTGLANRRSLVAQAPRLWRQARRDGLRVVALVLDLDHFKQLNDEHGHAAGDAVLQGVAAALSEVVRPSDLLARTGGEELVVLGLAADRREAARLGERLRAAVAGQRTATGLQVTASIGVALLRPRDGDDPVGEVWRLIDRADAAMYQAKQSGRDRVEMATTALPLPRAAVGVDDLPLPRVDLA